GGAVARRHLRGGRGEVSLERRARPLRRAANQRDVRRSEPLRALPPRRHRRRARAVVLRRQAREVRVSAAGDAVGHPHARDHPLAGVGAGSYQASFEEDYYSYKDPKIKANVTMSHTSFVTIMAELGVIGIVAVAFVAARWAMFIRSTSRAIDSEARAVLSGI